MQLQLSTAILISEKLLTLLSIYIAPAVPGDHGSMTRPEGKLRVCSQ